MIRRVKGSFIEDNRLKSTMTKISIPAYFQRYWVLARLQSVPINKQPIKTCIRLGKGRVGSDV